MLFEWDDRKAAHNLQKHQVSFEEASTIFDDVWMLTFDDPDHSFEEQRFISIGVSDRRRVLFVAHTDRDDTVQVISVCGNTARKETE